MTVHEIQEKRKVVGETDRDRHAAHDRETAQAQVFWTSKSSTQLILGALAVMMRSVLGAHTRYDMSHDDAALMDEMTERAK